ncbi:class I SAM-dependent methyltransferase [Kibdelosporangium lantanae]
MDTETEALLAELHEFGATHDATKADRLERFRNLEPDTARMMSVVARAAGARRVLELGTSNGYSTIWLADTVRATGGTLVTVDIDAGRSAMAAANLERAGLAGFVELRVQDAAETLRDSADDAWDLVFLDAERPHYVSYWPDLVRTIRPNGLLVVDNVLSHADQVAEFRAIVSADPRVTDAVVPTGAGALLVVVSA